MHHMALISFRSGVNYEVHSLTSQFLVGSRLFLRQYKRIVCTLLGPVK